MPSLPRFLETGQIVGSTFVMLSSRIIPASFTYEITPSMLVNYAQSFFGEYSVPFVFLSEDLLVVRTLQRPIPPAISEQLGRRVYYFQDSFGSVLAEVNWFDEVGFCILPINVEHTLAVVWDFDTPYQGSFYPLLSQFTVEMILGKGREIIIGNPQDAAVGLSNMYLGYKLTLYKGGTAFWDNYRGKVPIPLPLEQERTALKLTVFQHKHSFRDEYMLMLFGLTQQPLIFRFGSERFFVDPRITYVVTGTKYGEDFDDQVRLGECGIRMFGNYVLPPYSMQFQVPVAAVFDGTHSEIWDAVVFGSMGTFTLDWSRGGLIGKLVFGTTFNIPFGQATLTHPVVSVSVTQSFEQTMITQEANLTLMPMKYSDWQFEKWLFKPFYEFYVAVEEQVLFLGYRSRLSLQSEPGGIVRGEVSLMDNRTLLQRSTIDKPVIYDYWMATKAAEDFLKRFGLGFGTHALTPDIQLLPEFVSSESYFAWRPRLNETALDFLNRIADAAGWRLDFTQLGTVYALPRWEVTGSTWFLVWPEQAPFILSDIPVSRMNIAIDDFQRRNILIVYGIDADTFADTLRIYADIEALIDFSSERFFPLAVPAYVKFDRPVKAAILDRFGAWLSERLFVVPASIQFQTPLNFAIRPLDRLVFLNATDSDLHKYELVVTSVRHEIGRELTTFVEAKVYKQRMF